MRPGDERRISCCIAEFEVLLVGILPIDHWLFVFDEGFWVFFLGGDCFSSSYCLQWNSVLKDGSLSFGCWDLAYELNSQLGFWNLQDSRSIRACCYPGILLYLCSRIFFGVFS